MKQSGLSLIELMVVMGIMTLVTVMSFTDYSALRQKMSLKRTSEEIALIVRQAQAYSLGIKKSVSAGGDYFGFGVHFETNENNKKTLILFADSDSDKNYDDGELFQEFKIDTGDYIFGLDTYDSLSKMLIPVSLLDIVYPRTIPMAKINANDDLSYAKVTIKSPGGELKNIKIWISGQISVE